VSGCTGRYESDFPVVVVNRTANPIAALANGIRIGQVAPGQSGSFTLKLPESKREHLLQRHPSDAAGGRHVHRKGHEDAAPSPARSR
jgi:hypothetical protein